MKVAICYSGQLRNMRMMIDSHINCLFIPLIENNINIDVYMFSDNYNTTRTKIDGIKWAVSDVNKNLFKYFENKIENYVDKIKKYGYTHVKPEQVLNKMKRNLLNN